MPITIAGAEDERHHFRLDAARLHSPPPVADVHLLLEPGVTAFYGMNGAGKSRVLRGLGALLRGEECAGGLLHATSNLRSIDLNARDGFEGALAGLARGLDFMPEEEEWEDPDGDDPESEILVEALIAAMFWNSFGYDDCPPSDPPPEWVEDIAAMVGPQGLWVLRPFADPGPWQISPAFLVRDGDMELRQRLSNAPRRIGGDLTDADVAWANDLIEEIPLFSWGPLASALLLDGGPDLIARGIDDVLQSTSRPVELIAQDWDIYSGPASLDLVDVLDHSLPTSGDLTGRTMSILEIAGPEAVITAERLGERATEIVERAVPSGLTLRWASGAGEDGQSMWRASTRSQHDLDLRDLSDAQQRWCIRAIVLAQREIERMHSWLTARAERVVEEQRRLAAERRDLASASPEERAARAKEENEELMWVLEDEKHDYAARHAWERKHGYEPDVVVDIWSEDTFASEEPESYSSERFETRRTALMAADPEANVDELRLRNPQPPLVFLVDEPEAGLHRTAERGVVDMLVDVAATQRTPVFVATHSPEFLRNRHVRSFHVHRNDAYQVMIDDSFELLGDTASAYGLTRLDVLHIHDTILLVEGRHDEIVLHALLGNELRALRTLVVPLHGGRYVPHAADARILQDFTDHRILVMVDNLDAAPFVDLLDFARRLPPGDPTSFEQHVSVHFTNKQSDEAAFIIRLLRRAYDQGRLERFRPIGLAKLDILEYLPPQPFGLKETWDQLRSAYAKQTNVRSFKPWLTAKRNACFDDDRVQEACSRMDSIPDDLNHVIDVLRAEPS